MHSPRITIKDVAKRAGVSIATVSRFINNISLKKTNQIKVERAVKELKFKPSIYARRLAGGKLDSYGLIIPGYEGVFYSFYALEIIREVAAALNRKSIDLHLHVSWNKDSFKNSLVDGVIMADIVGNEKQFKRLIREEVPLVVLNRKVKEKNVSYVAINNFKGAFEATEFLINHGHSCIAHLAGDLRVQCAKERLDGYKSSLEKNKIKIKNNYIKNTNFSRKEARIKLEELFTEKVRPTAIFCCSDEVAGEVLNFAEEKNISIPKELSLIGFDDNPHCINGNLMLTTVRQPIQEMTRIAVDILRDIISGKQAIKQVVIETEMVIRDTVTFI